MKRTALITVLIIILLHTEVYASDNSKIIEEWTEQYNIEEIVPSGEEEFSDIDIKDIRKNLINGNGLDIGELMRKIYSAFVSEIKKMVMPFGMLVICSGAVSMGCDSNVLGKNKTGEIAKTALYCIYAVMALKIFRNSVGKASESVETVCTSTKGLIPVMAGIMTARGGVVTGAVLNSSLIVMITLFSDIMKNLVIPLSVGSAILSTANNVSDKVNITRLAVNLRGIAKWILVFILALYTGLFGIYGISGGAVDSSISAAAKFAVGSAIPLVGGVVADSMDTAITMLKSVSGIIGVCGIVLIVVSAAMPVIRMLVVIWGFRLCASVMEPFAVSNTVKLTSELADCCTLIFAVQVSSTLMFGGCVGLLMIAGNMV